jgi:hypothetical protein
MSSGFGVGGSKGGGVFLKSCPLASLFGDFLSIQKVTKSCSFVLPPQAVIKTSPRLNMAI